MTFAVRLSLLFALGLTLIGAARPDDLGQLLDRMRTRSGPVWSAHLTSASHLTIGNEIADVHSESKGLRFSTYECTGAICAGNYFDGERLYAININGTTLPASDTNDPFLRAERTIASLEFLAPDFVDNGGNIVDDGWATIAGKRFRTLLITNADATPMQIFVDPKSATVRYMRDVNGDTTLEYRNYAQVAGRFYLPFLVLRNGAVLEQYDSRDTTSDAFAAPHGPDPTFAGPPVPVHTDPQRSIPIFPCNLGGVATTCLLDSGNSGLSISKELAAELRAQDVGSFQVRGLGSYTTHVVRAGALHVGNATFPAANYVVLDDIHRFGYDVVLGADILAATTIGLDPVAHTVTFDAPAPTTGTSVGIEFQNFVPTLTVHLGTLGATLALDTGDESNINLAYEFYQEHRDLFTATQARTVSGVGGTSLELIGTIPEVRIGDLALHQQAIGATQLLRGTGFGHLGAGFLSNFNIVIDYEAGLVHFVPTPSPAPSP